MPTDFRFFRGKQYLKATPRGSFEFEHAKVLFFEAALLCASHANCGVLLDLRHAQIELSVLDLRYLATELIEIRQAMYRKIAIISPSNRFEDLAFFAVCSQNRGFKVKIFRSSADAVQWLSSGEG